MDSSAQASNRRKGPDRRQSRQLSLRSLFNNRRRRSIRRQTDQQGIVLLDSYHSSLMVPIVLVLGLSVLDAFFTLFLLDHGAVELNPIMAFFIQLGVSVFITAKYLITVVSVVIVVLLNYVVIARLKLRVSFLLTCFAAGFALLISWELFLVMRFVV